MAAPSPSREPTTATTITRDAGCVVITLHGNLDHAAAARLRRLLFDMTLCDQSTIAVDLYDVDHLGSTAIGGLVAARRWHQARGASMPLITDPTSAVHHLLTTTHLGRIFDVRASLGDVPR
jgi:anti-anti-sigma factor